MAVDIALIFPSNPLLMSILLHGWLWKGLTKSWVLYRGAWTPGAGGSLTHGLCQERRAPFIHLSAPSCSFSLALFSSQCSCFMAFLWREKRRKIISSVVLLFPRCPKCSVVPSSGREHLCHLRFQSWCFWQFEMEHLFVVHCLQHESLILKFVCNNKHFKVLYQMSSVPSMLKFILQIILPIFFRFLWKYSNIL